MALIFNCSYRFVANKYLIKSNYKGQDVEWAYAFDIHLNAFVPMLVISHIFQLIFYNGMYSKIMFY